MFDDADASAALDKNVKQRCHSSHVDAFDCAGFEDAQRPGKGTCGFTSFQEMCARDIVQEALESRGASDDVLQFWEEGEERFFASPTAHRKQGLETPARIACVYFMAHQLHTQFPEKNWFEAVAILDVYTSHAPTLVEVSELPTICEAILGLVSKFDYRVMFSNDQEREGCRCEQLANKLSQVGYAIKFPIVTQDLVKQQELAILGALNWRMPLATIESWMSAVCARVHTLLPGLFPALVDVWHRSLSLARALLVQVAYTSAASPKHLAIGLMGIAFVALRLVPPEVLGLDALDNFADVFEGMQPLNVPFQSHSAMLELLVVANGCNISRLEEDCKLVSSYIRREVALPKLGKVTYCSI